MYISRQQHSAHALVSIQKIHTWYGLLIWLFYTALNSAKFTTNGTTLYYNVRTLKKNHLTLFSLIFWVEMRRHPAGINSVCIHSTNTTLLKCFSDISLKMMKVCIMFSTETYRSPALPNWITVRSYTMFFQLSLSSMKSVMSWSDLNDYLKKKRKN